jgi:hypothetical protein
MTKVFISYSHDTVAHQKRVLGFAHRLRADGIDAEIDLWNASPPEGWPLWCERQIAAADFVLMVCTETYRRRVSGDEERARAWASSGKRGSYTSSSTMRAHATTSSCRYSSPRLHLSRFRC